MDSLNLDNWEEVNSSNIVAVGTKDNYLVVQFKNNVIYRYPDMASFYHELVTADSVGKFFHNNIRNQSCERLHGSEWPEEI